jgi:hypothetical protein
MMLTLVSVCIRPITESAGLMSKTWIRVSASTTTSPVAKQKDQSLSFRLLVFRECDSASGLMYRSSLRDMLGPSLLSQTVGSSCSVWDKEHEASIHDEFRASVVLSTMVGSPIKRRMYLSSQGTFLRLVLSWFNAGYSQSHKYGIAL